jgi:hypothetical protein
MKTFLAITSVLVFVIIIGAIEDPCTTEGLAPGCIETNSNQ